jgi:hypothetical protein
VILGEARTKSTRISTIPNTVVQVEVITTLVPVLVIQKEA